jgi:hypothetical protein
MPTYLICLSDDLEADAGRHAPNIGASVVKNFKDLQDHDVIILYTHGVYHRGPGDVPIASNQIEWNGRHLGADDVMQQMIRLGFPVPSRGVTVIVHACFSAGTVEQPPSAVNNTQTFAGQLCSALKALYVPGLRVIGYQGQTKVGMAGVRVGEQPSLRSSRNTRSPYDGSYWQVVYGGNGGHDGDFDGVAATGASVTWT